MMWLQLCGGGGGGDTSGSGSANLANISSYCNLVFIIILVNFLEPGECANANTAASKPNRKQPTALNDMDLIEGRLDSSGVCGIRYPTTAAAAAAAAAAMSALPAKHHKFIPFDTRGTHRAEANDRTPAEDLNHISGQFDSAKLLYIVGGDEVDDDQFWPWSVAIYELDPLNGRRTFICSGSLISDKFILTAAHCIQQSRFDILTPDEIFLKIASVRLDDDRSHFYEIDTTYIHPAYTVERKTNDIALLKLKPDQKLPRRARPICLPSNVANRTDFTDQQVTIIGWGKTSAMQGNEPSRLIDVISGVGGTESSRVVIDNNVGQDLEEQDDKTNLNGGTKFANGDERIVQETQTNDTLLQAEVRVTSTDQCNRNYSKLEISWLNIDEHFLCASDPQGKRDACQGDSGGPLMWNKQQTMSWDGDSGNPEKWFQLGLVSFGYGCANRQYPGVYTRISYYMPWILKIVGRKNVGTSSGRYPD